MESDSGFNAMDMAVAMGHRHGKDAFKLPALVNVDIVNVCNIYVCNLLTVGFIYHAGYKEFCL